MEKHDQFEAARSALLREAKVAYIKAFIPLLNMRAEAQSLEDWADIAQYLALLDEIGEIIEEIKNPS